MLDEQDAKTLLFAIQRSIRYHDRRVAHFDALHKVMNVFVIMSSGVVVLELAGTDSPWWIKLGAVITALFVACDLVVGFSHRANQHRDFKRRFCILEQRLVRAKSTGEIEELQVSRSEIEADEPPIFRALDAMCHNEMLMAQGYSPTDEEEKQNFHKLKWRQRVTANWFRWPNVSFTA